MKPSAPTPLEEKIAYSFRDHSLLAQALYHRSYANEMAGATVQDNERLEFLGDAVLNLVIGHLLMQRHPDLKEGDLSRMRAELVNETQLADIARRIDLGRFLRLGKGELQSGGHEKNSILADALEALLAAIYLDADYLTVFQVISSHFSDKLDTISVSSLQKDYKSRLQELVQSLHHMTPQYRMVDARGPDHDRTFLTKIFIGEIVVEGVGKSKKAAEQDAAKKALSILEEGL